MIPVGVFCYMVINGTLSLISPDLGASIAFISFVLVCIFIAIFSKNVITGTDRYNFEKMRAEFNKEIAEFDKTVVQSLRPYNKEIKELDDRIRRNYEIANS